MKRREGDDGSLYAFPRNLVLAASAGTGKTHALVGVVVQLLLGDRAPARGGGRAEPVDPARVVATTFSRKAAAEIRARVLLQVERLAAEPASSPYAASLRRAGRGGRALSDEDLRTRARHALARLPAARFGTLHSFATGIVRAHAVELGLGPGFELAPDAEARARAEEAIAAALEARMANEPGSVRSLADAAGGVDRLVGQLRRLLVQLEEDGRAARDLAVREEDAAALEAQFSALLRHAEDLTSAARFQDPARELVSAWRELGSAAPGSHEADRLEQLTGAFTGVSAVGKKTPEVEAFAVFRKGLGGATNEEKGRRLALAYTSRHDFAAQARLVRDVLADAEAEIESAGRARASIGFGEILRAARELLRDHPDVAADVAKGIDALLVDEFQDTSRVQRDLLQLLWARDDAREAGRVPPLGAVRDRGLLVVGDRKQSIYGFRGADVGVFAELAVGLAGRPAREALGIPAGVTWEPREPLADFHALRHNRRSEPEILAFANAFSARRFAPGDPPPELYEIEYVAATEDLLVPPERALAVSEVASAQVTETSAVVASTLEDLNAREGERTSGEPTPVAPRTTWLRVAPKGSSSSRLEEALVVAARVTTLVEERGVARGASRAQQEQHEQHARRPRYRDVAVLATSNAMLDAVAFAFAQAEIPYVVAGKSFFRAREVRDLAAMLALVLDPLDKLAALEVLRGPWVGAHDETLLGLTRPGEGLVAPYDWSAPPTPSLVSAEERARVEEAGRVVMELARASARLGPAVILREAMKALSLEAVLGALPRGTQRVANARKLLVIAERHVDARAFRAWLDEASEQEISESEAATFSEEDDAVRLLTIHASKGLDFPIVFVPEIGAGLPRSEKGAARIETGAGDEANVLSVRLGVGGGVLLEPPSFVRAYGVTKRRERAERQRLAYVAITRAAEAMFLVGGRSKEGGLDRGASSLAVLEELAGEPTRAALAVEDVVPPSLQGPKLDALPEASAEDEEAVEASAASSPPPPLASRALSTPARREPGWRALPIAPTALADFAHCKRRFELVHLLALPEHVRGGRTAERAEKSARAVTLDARAQGTLAHAVLERVPRETFAAEEEEARAAASRALAAEGVPPEHPAHDAITARVVRFLTGTYARAVREAGAEVRREVSFVLPIEDGRGRAVVLGGSMDLVVVWPDGGVDVVDYKSARSGASGAYGFQLDVYALAARARHDVAPRLRAGLVYLGGKDAGAEPLWREPPDESALRSRLGDLGGELASARWSGRFARVELARCESIYCGFIGRCHPSSKDASGVDADGIGTEAKPSRETTT